MIARERVAEIPVEGAIRVLALMGSLMDMVSTLLGMTVQNCNQGHLFPDRSAEIPWPVEGAIRVLALMGSLMDMVSTLLGMTVQNCNQGHLFSDRSAEIPWPVERAILECWL